MSNLIVRAYRPEDDEAFRHVRSVVFRGGEAVKPEDRLLRDDCLAYVAEANGDIVAATTVLDMTATLGDKALRCGGLAAVAVVPEMRGRGAGSALMIDILPMLKEEGFSLASLYPYRSSYYRKFGYSYCGMRFQIKCPTDRLPRIKAELPIRMIPYAERENIYECYERFCRRYAGMNLRKSEDQWWRVLGGDTPLQIYAAGDPIEGYAVLRLHSGFWEVQPVKELVWNTHRAYTSLLSLFGSLSVNKTALEWLEPGDSPFLAGFIDQGTDAALFNNVMFRILDVPTVLSAVPHTGEGEFTFVLDDAQMPQNRGAWHVCFENGATRIERASSGSINMTMSQLTQSTLGEPSFESLVRNGGVSGPKPDLDAAQAFFGSRRVYCTDFF